MASGIHFDTIFQEKIMTNAEKVNSVVKKMAAAMERGDIEAVMAAYEREASLVVQPL